MDAAASVVTPMVSNDANSAQRVRTRIPRRGRVCRRWNRSLSRCIACPSPVHR